MKSSYDWSVVSLDVTVHVTLVVGLFHSLEDLSGPSAVGGDDAFYERLRHQDAPGGALKRHGARSGGENIQVPVVSDNTGVW